MLQNHSVTQSKQRQNALAGPHLKSTRLDENWLRMLDAYRVHFLVLNLNSESDMAEFFRSQPGWEVDFEDEESIIFARTEDVEAIA